MAKTVGNADNSGGNRKPLSQPSRSNRGGALRGQDRASQVHAMNALKKSVVTGKANTPPPAPSKNRGQAKKKKKKG